MFAGGCVSLMPHSESLTRIKAPNPVLASTIHAPWVPGVALWFSLSAPNMLVHPGNLLAAGVHRPPGHFCLLAHPRVHWCQAVVSRGHRVPAPASHSQDPHGSGSRRSPTVPVLMSCSVAVPLRNHLCFPGPSRHPHALVSHITRF